ncbi:hypothetical protein RZS08_60995, partial [Arthrospira platensis SPKY1]|nr:hypothetical protein [Arthrospira platensis SPKY1]
GNQASVIAHELLELRFWRQFAKEVLHKTDAELSGLVTGKDMRSWIKDNLMHNGEVDREFVELLLDDFHALAEIAEMRVRRAGLDNFARQNLTAEHIKEMSDII